MNRQADAAAASAHGDPEAILSPPLTGYMPEFVFWTFEDGFNVGNWRRQLEERLVEPQVTQLPTRERQVFSHPELNPTAPRVPEFYYTKAVSGTVARIQYIMRTRLVPTGHYLKLWRPGSDPSCALCGVLEQDGAHCWIYDPAV